MGAVAFSDGVQVAAAGGGRLVLVLKEAKNSCSSPECLTARLGCCRVRASRVSAPPNECPTTALRCGVDSGNVSIVSRKNIVYLVPRYHSEVQGWRASFPLAVSSCFRSLA